MKYPPVPMVILAVSVLTSGPARPAEITEVIDAADGDDPIDINLDVGFHYTLDRSKITHEYKPLWERPEFANRPDFDELRFERQIFAMDYTIEIGLYHDLELYVNIPWIIQDKKKISYVKGQNNLGSTLYRDPAAPADPEYPGNALAVDPTNNPTTERAGIGDMQLGVKWAAFNDERDDTKSVWIIGLEYAIPSGELALPQQVAGGKEGTVGLGQHGLTPFMLFSHRFLALEPYVGMRGTIPIQDRNAERSGFKAPYHGGLLTGMEIIPWENPEKHQKFAIDLRLTTEYFGEVESKGHKDQQGYITELSDFLTTWDYTSGIPDPNKRQLQYVGNYTQFGIHLGFVVRAAEFVRLRFGASLAHNTEHFITGADYCDDKTNDGDCMQAEDIPNNNRNKVYDDPGRRIRVEESTLFTLWVTGMMTF